MRHLSDLPAPSRRPHRDAPRVVTLGGGHGQAALLSALLRLDCELTALVSVADDGGCSGKLRQELGMAPPGDVRRCLVTLATVPDAGSFEERLTADGEEGRCVGNLVLAEMTRDLGSFQRAVDWVGTLLGCTGRVVPVADVAGTLNVYDRVHGRLSGESHIELLSGSAMVARVDGPDVASPEALGAIEGADFIFMGPGSFVGSTLAAIVTGNIPEAVVRARGRRVLVRNVRPVERTGFPGAVQYDDQERILRDHLVIGSGDDSVAFDVLLHDACDLGDRPRADGSRELLGPVASDDGRRHDPARLASVLSHHLRLAHRAGKATAAASEPADAEAQAIFQRYLASARARLRGGA